MKRSRKRLGPDKQMELPFVECEDCDFWAAGTPKVIEMVERQHPKHCPRKYRTEMFDEFRKAA